MERSTFLKSSADIALDEMRSPSSYEKYKITCHIQTYNYSTNSSDTIQNDS